jgi:hypothetical protein
MTFGFYVSFCTTIIMSSSAVSDFRLLHFVHPNSLSVRAIPRIIFFRRLNFLEVNKVTGKTPFVGVISHKNPTPAVLEYALSVAYKAGFQLNRGIFHSTDSPAYLCCRIFIKAAVRGFRTDDTDDG